jgi:hypothetical protein
MIDAGELVPPKRPESPSKLRAKGSSLCPASNSSNLVMSAEIETFGDLKVCMPPWASYLLIFQWALLGNMKNAAGCVLHFLHHQYQHQLFGYLRISSFPIP